MSVVMLSTFVLIVSILCSIMLKKALPDSILVCAQGVHGISFENFPIAPSFNRVNRELDGNTYSSEKIMPSSFFKKLAVKKCNNLYLGLVAPSSG
jgi:hypothetical protein